MKQVYRLTKVHDTYIRDGVILAIIGVLAGLLYALLTLLLAQALAYMYIILCASWLWVFKQRFNPESYVVTKNDDKWFIWNKSEYKDKVPDEKELIAVKQTEQGIMLTIKELGFSNIKRNVELKQEGYGEDALKLLLSFKEATGEFSIEEKAASISAEAGVFTHYKNNQGEYVQSRYKPAKVPVSVFAYVLLLVTIYLANQYIAS